MEDWEKEYQKLTKRHKLTPAKQKKLYDLMKSHAEIKKSLEPGKVLYLVSNLRYTRKYDDFFPQKFDIYKARQDPSRESFYPMKSYFKTGNLPMTNEYSKRVFKGPYSKFFDAWPQLQHGIFRILFA
jgi:hypothetical protein